jgi:ABC-type bacteriocin/lantibiotic exporter with double-glycine peptidase domain
VLLISHSFTFYSGLIPWQVEAMQAAKGLRSLFYSLFFVCLSFIGFAVASDESVEMRRYRCGYNSVYILLRLSGRDLEYHSLEINRNSGKDGATIQELVDELSRCGLPSRAIQCSGTQDVCKLSPPFILYTNPDRSGKTIGHFLVVTQIGSTTIDLIDGTTGEEKQYAIDKLENLWDGLVIVPEKNQSIRWHWIITGVLASIGLFLIAPHALIRRT